MSYDSPFPPAGGSGIPAQAGFGSGGFPQQTFAAPAQRPAGSALPQDAPAPASRSAKKSRKKEEGKAPTKRAVSRSVVLATVFALLAGGFAYMTLNSAGDPVYVVRAADDIAAGTRITESHLEAVLLPPEAVEPNTFTAETGDAAIEEAVSELEGTVAQFPLGAKTQIRSDQFGLQVSLGAQLAPNERLVSIQASVGTAVAGALRVGDRVDIIGATDQWTSVVAYDVPIVAITVSEDRYNSVADRQTADPAVSPGEVLPGDPVPGIYVVRVPAELVPVLLNWNESATLHLAYRGAGAQTVVVPDNRLGEQAPQVPAPSVTDPVVTDEDVQAEQDA
jgi:Flp pilus assembly protein CpaB